MEVSKNIQDLQVMLNEASSSYQSILLQTHNQALLQNAIQTKRWEDYKKDHEELSDRLLNMRDSLSHPVMVPIGKKALMRGQLVHTNEILVCLGDGWFAKQSAKQAADICKRRIQSCDEMLDKLKKEEELLNSRKTFPFENEAFSGTNQTQEIIEAYDEEEEKKWREKHRQKEKEYRKKLAELRQASKPKIESEEDLWRRLDALDMQEELEDDLNRMNEDMEEEEEDTESDSEEDVDSDDNTCELEEKSEKNCLQRRVSFKEEKDSCENKPKSENEDNAIRIVFKHSETSVPVPPISSEIMSPSDIYTQYLKQKAPKSILKPSPVVNNPPDFIKENSQTNLTFDQIEDQHPVLHEEPAVKAVSDQVVERTAEVADIPQVQRPVSKFKAARMSSKR
ncbi:unconventional prefoldin RPB5 interactor-like protein [Macrosteles quadrilineatus]|uniref:unconventional prefoldin RPB5 interactor-like protein n=1 Tax=Macrosteles quadrilineatus TaxID=74068 RepID=UPI0023E33168|nr:unconventional prefoldin RPB5 interactor-like protein [Macrosteles quadrilineatus]